MSGSESKQARSLIRVPRLSLLIVLACLLILGTLLAALWTTARSGIRQVQASGGELQVAWNPVSLFITDFIWMDRMYLSTDHDVDRVDLFAHRRRGRIRRWVHAGLANGCYTSRVIFG